MKMQEEKRKLKCIHGDEESECWVCSDPDFDRFPYLRALSKETKKRLGMKV